MYIMSPIDPSPCTNVNFFALMSVEYIYNIIIFIVLFKNNCLINAQLFRPFIDFIILNDKISK